MKERALSKHTSRAYERGIRQFREWFRGTGQLTINADLVNLYLRMLEDSGKSKSTIAITLAAIKAWAREQVALYKLPKEIAYDIAMLSLPAGSRSQPIALTRNEAIAILSKPELNSLRGVRDMAILAVILYSHLRREAVAALKVADMGNLDALSQPHVTRWLMRANITSGNIFRSIHKSNMVMGESMTGQAVADVVITYAPPGVTADMLRRIDTSAPALPRRYLTPSESLTLVNHLKRNQ